MLSIVQLDDETPLPDPANCKSRRVVATGGRITAERIREAYTKGIFPWPDSHPPLKWWSPDPRFVLFPDQLIVAKSMRPYFNQQKFRVTYDTAFEAVIKGCAASPRTDQDGTWITPEVIEAYTEAHKMGIAHSVEVWKGNELAGGLYGISTGAFFCGESMFSRVPNASKFGFISLVRELQKRGFLFIDCQVYTSHLQSLGAINISRKDFLWLLDRANALPCLPSPWRFDGES